MLTVGASVRDGAMSDAVRPAIAAMTSDFTFTALGAGGTNGSSRFLELALSDGCNE